MVDVMAALGPEPVYEHLGVVDFRRRSYAGGAQRVIDGAVYGRGEDGVWTCLELGSREPIGPVWMLYLLTGATSVTAVAQAQSPAAGARSVEGVADLFAARKVTRRGLEGVGGAPRSSMRAIPVTAVVGADGLAERVTAEVHDHGLTCEFWDCGTEEPITVPGWGREASGAFVCQVGAARADGAQASAFALRQRRGSHRPCFSGG
jgi:hypothetical protein